MNTQEPCIRHCKFINDGVCTLYGVELLTSLTKDEYDEGYVQSYLKCQDCLEKELSNKIDIKIDDIKSLYDVFVFEMDVMMEQLETLKLIRRGVYEKD